MAQQGVTLNFKIDEDYFLVHLISHSGERWFSSKEYMSDIVGFRDYAWGLDKDCYSLFKNDLSITHVVSGKLVSLLQRSTHYLELLKKSDQYQKLYQQTEAYLSFCKAQWEKNYRVTHDFLQSITDFDFNRTIDVYITHPGLLNGVYLPRISVIEWSNRWENQKDERFLNYTTVYLWHEVLHSYFEHMEIAHVLIELITDNEMRVRLNGGIYPPFEGHNELEELRQNILPQWQAYLKSGRRDIIAFLKEIS